jgi:antitoxin component YwqK of YwqJK toxin-antitoxin module
MRPLKQFSIFAGLGMLMACGQARDSADDNSSISRNPPPLPPTQNESAVLPESKLTDVEKRDEKGNVVGQLDNGLWYRRGDMKPYTGVISGHYKNGQIESKRCYENGAQVGTETHWYDTGQKRWEMIYKNGQMVSIRQWDADGNEQSQ